MYVSTTVCLLVVCNLTGKLRDLEVYAAIEKHHWQLSFRHGRLAFADELERDPEARRTDASSTPKLGVDGPHSAQRHRVPEMHQRAVRKRNAADLESAVRVSACVEERERTSRVVWKYIRLDLGYFR